MKAWIKNIYRGNSKWSAFACMIYNLLMCRSFRALRTAAKNPMSFFKKVKIKGNRNNQIQVGRQARLNDCTFVFMGSGNRVQIAPECNLNHVTFWLEESGNTILIGRHTTITGQTELACLEGTCIEIGSECLFARGINLRTGDSHSVLDLQGKRTNPSKDISIGSHVWIGQDVFIQKNAKVANNSIVAAKAVLTKQFETEHVVLAGNPARVVKENVNWDAQRL